MTRKDYILLAKAMQRSYLHDSIDGKSNFSYDAQYIHTCNCLASDLGFDNPRFDRIRFLEACGIDTSDFPMRIKEDLKED